MRKKLLIVEGFDGCGKTTLSNNILKERPGKYVKNTYEGEIDANIQKGLDVLHEVTQLNDAFTLFDRFHGISDPVLDVEHQYVIEHNVLTAAIHYMQHKKLDIQVIWLQCTKEEMVERLSGRESIVPMEQFLLDNFDKCNKNAQVILNKYMDMGIPVHVINTANKTEEQTLDTALYILNQWEERTCK